MDLFIAWDGDHIGRKVGQLALNDDEEGLRRVSQAIDSGNRLMAAWVNAALGAMISYGGDEGRARIPATALGDVERIRVQYAQAVGSPVSVGVGIRLSEADKALLSAKVRGGDQVMLYGPDVDRDLEQLQEKTEAQKLGDEYLTKAEKFGQAAFRHKQNGTIVPSGLIHDMDYLPGGEDSIDHYESGFISKDGQFVTEQQAKELENRLKKDDESAGPKTKEAPVNNASAGGGYTPIHEIGGDGGAPEPPMQEASEHTQGEAMRSMADETSSPEGSGTAGDFESELHDHAQEQDQKDKDDEDAKNGRADARKKVLEILSQVKEAAPALEQLRDQAPDLYGVLMQMTQALVITSRGLLDNDQQQSDSEKVVDQKGEESSSNEASSPASEPTQKSELQKAFPHNPDVPVIYPDHETAMKYKQAAKTPQDMLNATDTRVDVRAANVHRKGKPIPTQEKRPGAGFPKYAQQVGADLNSVSPENRVMVDAALESGFKPEVPPKFVPKPTATAERGSVITQNIEEEARAHNHQQLYRHGVARYPTHSTTQPALWTNKPDVWRDSGQKDSYYNKQLDQQYWSDVDDASKQIEDPKHIGEVSQFGQAYDYSHHLPPEMQQQGMKLHVQQHHGADAFMRAALFDPSGKEVFVGQDAAWAYPSGEGVHISGNWGGAEEAARLALENHRRWVKYGGIRKAELPPVGLTPPPVPQLHNDLKGFLGGLKTLPVGSPERGRFLTQHMNHPPIVQALQATPQGRDLHAKLMTHLNGKANAGFKPGATQTVVKDEDGLEKVQSHVNLPVGATKDGKVKVRHEDGKAGWVSVRAGQVLSNDGHPVSSRNPGGH